MSFKGGNKKSNVYPSDEGYNLYADQYDLSSGFLNSFENYELLRMFGDLKGKKILDVGCGTGRIVRDLIDSGGEVTALDISSEMLKLCEKRFPRIECVVGDVEDMPFEDGTFDVCVSMFLIVHLRDLQQAFDEVYRVMKDGGMFILSNVNQRKAPKLKLADGKEIVIESYYHRPEDVLKALDRSFFKVEDEKFVYDNDVWINQIIKVRK